MPLEKSILVTVIAESHLESRLTELVEHARGAWLYDRIGFVRPRRARQPCRTVRG